MSILDIGNYFRMLKPENNVTQNTGSNATKLLQILCKSVGQNCNTAFLFCLKRSQEQPTKKTLELTNNLRKIRCNVTPNTKPLTPADREAETARQNAKQAEQADRIKQLEENALRSAEDKLRYDQHFRRLQQQIEGLTRNPVRKQLHYGAQRAPADFLLDPELSDSRNGSSEEDFGQVLNETEEEQPQQAQARIRPAPLVRPAIPSSQEDYSDHPPPRRRQAHRAHQPAAMIPAPPPPPRRRHRQVDPAAAAPLPTALIPTPEQKRLLVPLPEPEVYVRDAVKHINDGKREKGDALVATAETSLQQILDSRPEGDGVNSLQWVEANIVSGTTTFNII